MKKTFLINIIVLLLSLSIVFGWTQYTSSPTTNDISKVFSFNGNRAYAITTSMQNCLNYNYTWNEIVCPDDLYNLSGYTYFGIGKTDNGRVIIAYTNNTGGVYYLRTYIYNPSTNTYSLNNEFSNSVAFTNFYCSETDNTCYATDKNLNTGASGHNITFQVYPSQINTTTNRNVYLLYSNSGIYGINGTYGTNILEYNGLNWINRGTITRNAVKIYVTDSNNRILADYNGTQYNLSQYNRSSGLFSSGINAIHYYFGGNIIRFNNKFYSVSGTNNQNISSYVYGLGDAISDLDEQSIGQTINWIDTDSNNYIIWAVGNGGRIYYQNRTTTTNSIGTSYNGTMTLINLTNGTNIISNVIGLTNYSNHVFGIGKDENNRQIIFDIDLNDVNNPLINSLSISDANKSIFFNSFTSIATSNQYVYVGSNDGLYLYNKTNSETIRNSVFVNSFANLYNYPDATALNDGVAFVCRNGLLSSNTKLFNTTSLTFDATLSGSSCKSLLLVNDLLIIHEGNQVEIFNSTSNTLISTISSSYFNSLNSQAANDLLSYKDGTLFVLTANNGIKLFSLNNNGSTTYVEQCHADRAIQSLEAASNNQALVGATNQIKVCDFGNNDTYYGITDGYIATNLFSIAGSSTINDVIRVNNNYIASTKDNIYVFNYVATTSTTSSVQLPTINDVVLSNPSPCVNEPVYVSIDATDNQGLQITYDWNCNIDIGTQFNHYLATDFTCQYSAAGNYVISVYATNNASVSGNKFITPITVSNCTANNSFYMVFIDGITGLAVENVIVTLNGTTSYTNNLGIVSFNVPSNNNYDFTYSKAGYYDGSGNDYPHKFYVYIEPTETTIGTGRTVLNIITKADNGSLLQSSTVNVLDVLTGQSYSGLTNINGLATIFDVLPSNKYLVSATNDVLDYLYVHDYTSITIGQTKTVTLIMSKTLTTAEQGEVNPLRHCRDAIAFTMLCGNLSTSGSGSGCSVDNDCITDSCVGGVCSSFNWSICDYNNEVRGNGCFLNAIAGGGIKNRTGGVMGVILNFFLNSFLWVIIIIIILLFVLILRKRD